MGERVPGPLCSTRVGADWIDGGTTCRTRSSTPGPTGLGVADALAIVAMNLNPSKAKFDREHVYSNAREAGRKRDIDLQIIGDDYSRSAEISLNNGNYLKELIRLGSNGKQKVSESARKIQFFIIRGGAEGFLGGQPFLAGRDMTKENAGNVVFERETTDHKKIRSRFDLNDVVAVFDPKGNLIGVALLERPISIPGRISEEKTTKVYDSWNNKAVAIYRNANFSVEYLGLVVDDGMKGKDGAWIDLHKREATNGCIMIEDPDTPGLDSEEINNFEPKLIKDIVASIGKRPDEVRGTLSLGIMHVVDIK